MRGEMHGDGAASERQGAKDALPHITLIGEPKAVQEQFLRLRRLFGDDLEVLSAVRDRVYMVQHTDCWRVFSIGGAKRLIAEGQAFCVRVDLPECGITLDRLPEWNPEIDHDYAMQTDLSEPGIAIAMPDATTQIIDGWHRLYKALTVGLRSRRFWVIEYEVAKASGVLLYEGDTPPPSLAFTSDGGVFRFLSPDSDAKERRA